ncbi:hypothetical protein OCU04_000900 [Sclerotinia nivalis]|uniref:Uncharacterized protein n=1 Tax=Sclerotinia nivalis TaxID=352851 RepID=A0A9X0AX23_9HELO|nr:hypothetical protein OCU04_000900 [Sclerotinia nivalis]
MKAVLWNYRSSNRITHPFYLSLNPRRRLVVESDFVLVEDEGVLGCTDILFSAGLEMFELPDLEATICIVRPQCNSSANSFPLSNFIPSIHPRSIHPGNNERVVI